MLDSTQPIIKNINIPDPETEAKKTFGQKLYSSFKKNPIPYLQGAGYVADGLLSYNKEVMQDVDYENEMRNRFQQEPIFDYNYMYGPGTNGGSQFQPIIKAEDGAIIRKGSAKALPIEIEGGEFLQLPDGTLELAKGKSHDKGGIPTLLPQGTKVFSNNLKPEGSKKTFAQLAKDNDYTKEKDVLNNFFALDVSKKSAELMMGRKVKALNDLFSQQQFLNDNSTGNMTSLKNGAKMMYSEGGEYEMSQEEIDDLIKQGYKIDYVK